MLQRFGIFLLALLPLTAQAGPPIDEAIDELVARWGQVRSFAAELNVEAFSDVGVAQGYTSTTGAVSWKRQGDSILYRIEMNTQHRHVTDNEETIRSNDSFVAFDGEQHQSWIQHGGDELFYSIIPPDSEDGYQGPHGYMLIGDRGFYDELLEDTVIAMRERKTDDYGTLVVLICEIKEKLQIGFSTPARFEIEIQKEIGVPVRTTLFDEDGNILSSISYTNVKVNVDYPSDFFSTLPSPRTDKPHPSSFLDDE